MMSGDRAGVSDQSLQRSNQDPDPAYFSEGMRSGLTSMDAKKALRDSRPREEDWKAVENDKQRLTAIDDRIFILDRSLEDENQLPHKELTDEEKANILEAKVEEMTSKISLLEGIIKTRKRSTKKIKKKMDDDESLNNQKSEISRCSKRAKSHRSTDEKKKAKKRPNSAVRS